MFVVIVYYAKIPPMAKSRRRLPFFSFLALAVLFLGLIALIDSGVALAFLQIGVVGVGLTNFWFKINILAKTVEFWEGMPDPVHLGSISLFLAVVGAFLVVLFKGYIPKVDVKLIEKE